MNPAAAEAWYDGVDADCDGNDADRDGDGFGATLAGGDDCDDDDAAVNPAAVEAWYDGVDADCDGRSDDDQDGDGIDAYAYGGGDCDDTDPTTAAGPAEADNGVDDDCDGFVDEGFDAQVIVTEVMFDPAAVADEVGEWFEVYNAGADAVDLSGWEVVATDGDAFTITGALPLASGARAVLGVEADPALNGGVPVDWVYGGFSLDEADDIALVEGGTTVSVLAWDATWPGAPGTAMGLDDDHTGADAGAVGSWCAAAATYGDGDRGTPGAGGECWLDDDGDGYALTDCDDGDAAIHPTATETTDGVDESCDGLVDEPAYTAATLLVVTGTTAGLRAASLGDFDGDGLVEVAAVEPGSDAWSFVAGEGYAGWGGAVSAAADAGFTAVGAAVGFTAAMPAGADLDGDGVADLGYANTAGDPGFSLVWGPFGGARDADVRFAAVEPAGTARLRADGDFDGDGQPELVYANPASTYGADGGGAVALFGVGALAGTIDYGAATLVLAGDVDDAVGAEVLAGDMDGDGYDDLAIAGAEGTALWRGDGFATTGLQALASVATATVPVSDAGASDLALVDADHDGTLDLVRTDAARDVRWYLDAGALSGTVGADDDDARWTPPAYGDTRANVWTSLALLDAPLDVDGDGFPEPGVVATSVYSAAPLFAWFGADALVDGAVSGEEALAAFTLDVGTAAGTLVGDLDGDGVEELVVSDPDAAGGAGGFGVAGR